MFSSIGLTTAEIKFFDSIKLYHDVIQLAYMRENCKFNQVCSPSQNRFELGQDNHLHTVEYVGELTETWKISDYDYNRVLHLSTLRILKMISEDMTYFDLYVSRDCDENTKRERNKLQYRYDNFGELI